MHNSLSQQVRGSLSSLSMPPQESTLGHSYKNDQLCFCQGSFVTTIYFSLKCICYIETFQHDFYITCNNTTVLILRRRLFRNFLLYGSFSSVHPVCMSCHTQSAIEWLNKYEILINLYKPHLQRKTKGTCKVRIYYVVHSPAGKKNPQHSI